MQHANRLPLAAALAGTLLTACGGGGGAGTHVTPATAPTASSAAPVTLSITIPPPDPNAIVPRSAPHRRPMWVSPSTGQIKVYLNGASTPAVSQTVSPPTAPPPGGTATYQISMTAPVGSDTFLVALLDAAGQSLAQGQTTQNIVSGPNTVTVTELGIPGNARFSVTDANARPSVGRALTIPLNLMITDVDGNPISGTFAVPVTLSVVSQAASDYTLESTSLVDSNAAAAVTVSYDGRTSLPARVLVSTVLNSRPAVATIRPGAAAYGNAALVALNTGSGGVVRIDASTRAVSSVATFTANPLSLAASPYGNVALIGLDNGTIGVYDGTTRTIASQITTRGVSVPAVTFTDDGTRAYALVNEGTGGLYQVQPLTTSTTSSTVTTGTAVFISGTSGNCGGIAADVNVPNVVLLSCTNAVYRVDTSTAGTPASFAGSYGTAAVTQALPPYVSYTGTANASARPAVFAFQLSNTGAAFTQINAVDVPGPAIGMALDPTQLFLYAGGAGQIWSVKLDQNGGFVAAVPLQTGGTGTVTAIGDYPGGAAGAPDQTVWGGATDAKVYILSNFGAPTQIVSVSAAPVGIGFVP